MATFFAMSQPPAITHSRQTADYESEEQSNSIVTIALARNSHCLSRGRSRRFKALAGPSRRWRISRPSLPKTAVDYALEEGWIEKGMYFILLTQDGIDEAEFR